MELALHVWNFSPLDDPAALAVNLAATAKAADAGGFRTLTLMDHYLQMEAQAPPTEPMLEGYTALGYLAGITERLQLGLLVTGVTYRHPGLLAKIIATLDVVSGGRAMLGIGAAWYEREHHALGVPYPPMAERFERLEETLRICRQMWSGTVEPFDGKHYQLAETLCVPLPIQQPRPPILIGGSGERKTLRLVAQYADACNLFATGPDELKHKIDVLDGHCRDVGRDPAEIQKTIMGSGGTPDPLDDVDDTLRRLESCAALGVTRTWVGIPLHHPDPAGWTSQVAERVLPRVAQIGPR